MIADNGTVKMWDMIKEREEIKNTGVDVYAVKKWSPLLVLRPEGPSRKAKKRKKANGDAAAAAAPPQGILLCKPNHICPPESTRGEQNI